MDRRRALLRKARSRRIFAGLVLFAAACAAAPEADPPLNRDSLRALRWFAPGADLVTALTTRPGSCPLDFPTTIGVRKPPEPPPISVGRIAFESPALLGGAAGRMGLSCSACHLNGRGNPDFFVEGVSGAPGTADVTNSLFSKVRGNGTFDPKPIPDVAARDGKQIRDRTGPEFRTKVHGLIAEEFDGQEPSAWMMDAVIAYMDGLNVRCADAGQREPLTAEADVSAGSLAFAFAQDLSGDDRHLMVRAARERLERLYERFAGHELAPVREALLAASRAMQAWLEAPGAAEASAAGAAMRQAEILVFSNEGRSLYNPEVLRKALAAR